MQINRTKTDNPAENQGQDKKNENSKRADGQMYDRLGNNTARGFYEGEKKLKKRARLCLALFLP